MLLSCIGAALWLGACLTPAQAQESDFWRGKTVTIIAPTAPGGGYDAYTRMVARHIGKHLPGQPGIVVQNMPGAGGMVAANHLYNVAPKDGTVFALFDRAIPTAPLLYGEDSKARFDPLKLNWLGSLAREAGMGVVSTKAPAQTVEEAKKTELFFGSTGHETDAATYVRLFNELFGTRIKVIPTYKAQPEIFLAIERGELHGLFVTGYSANARTYVEDQISKGQMKLLVQMTLQKDPALPDVPGVLDYVSKEQDRQVIELLLSRLSLGRPFIAPPDLPPERVAALRGAFEKLLQDADFLADAQKSGLPVQPILAGEAEEIIRRLYQYPPKIVQRTRSLVRGQ
ncbi:MAG TPA: tripartite tricarboxylate transporter substrate-binding protein [Xanthobacteraceae bacterium]|nr:tripartite tricarboxylate transporter substrate-binding protein [Xanthobacteraceae bacterium]